MEMCGFCGPLVFVDGLKRKNFQGHNFYGIELYSHLLYGVMLGVFFLGYLYVIVRDWKALCS